jgi:hypothetical protein
MVTPAAMVMENVSVAVFWAESVTVIEKLAGPGVPVGLPEIAPAVERLNPAGSVEPLASAQVYPELEPPVAASVCE